MEKATIVVFCQVMKARANCIGQCFNGLQV